MNPNILICSAGRRVSLVEYFKQQSHQLLGGRGRVFSTDLEPDYAPACRCSDKGFAIGRFNDPNYVSTLLRICQDNRVGMVIPTIDTELLLLARHRNEFESRGIALIVSDLDLIAKCRDKHATNRFFHELQIDVPRPIDIEQPVFPFFVKPVSGSSSKDIFVIKDESYLAPYLRNREKFVHQEYLSPQLFEEYTVDLYYDRQSQLRCAVPRRRLEVRGGEISKGFTIKNEVFNLANRMLKRMQGARGCITLQVFLEKSSNKIYGIEINPRFGGGYPLSYLAGANFPAMLIREYILGETVDYSENWEERLLLLRYDSEMIVHASQH